VRNLINFKQKVEDNSSSSDATTEYVGSVCEEQDLVPRQGQAIGTVLYCSLAKRFTFFEQSSVIQVLWVSRR
jgi:hypothetical protein